ncbi:MAG: formate dehydrogenase subunit delta [Paracoccaceae bacterium]|jgi:formate dehydrogenase subunit delta
MTDDKMIRMANQIAGFFATQPGAGQAGDVAAHINDFWEPRMRAVLLAYVSGGGAGLDALVIAAVPQIRRPGLA